MRGLNLRLVVILAALSLIGLSVADVAFILWAQRQLGRERTLALTAAAQASAAALEAPAPGAADRLAPIARQYDVAITALDRQGGRVATATVPLPVATDGRRVIEAGFEHILVSMPENERFSSVIASQPLSVVVDRVLAVQRWAVAVLALAAMIMVAAGLLFLRRAVTKPIARMTAVVGARDVDALSDFGGSEARPGDDLAALGRAIIGMTQQIDEDRRRKETQLAAITRAHRELEATQDQLVRAARLAVVGQLAAGIAHEIGNPLTVVSGYIEMLRDEVQRAPAEPLGPEALETLERMIKELSRIETTVRSLLDFSRAQDSQGRGKPSEALAQACTLMRAHLRHADLELDTAADLPAVGITTDALTQVLLNLLFNAADAVAQRDGRGVLKVSTTQGGDRLTIAVEDSGPGIPPEEIEQIFEPFFTTKPAGRGTGLGLAVCDRIVNTAGGEIAIEKSSLGGARVKVSLPLATD